MQNKPHCSSRYFSSIWIIFILASILSPLKIQSKSFSPAHITQNILPDMIHVDPEPVLTSSWLTGSASFQSENQQNEVSWDNLDNLHAIDDSFSTVNLGPGEVSEIIYSEGFSFKIPAGSGIQQIRLHVNGHMIGNAKPVLISAGLSNEKLEHIGTSFYHKSGQGAAWPVGNSGSWYYSPNQTDWITGLDPDSVNTNKWKIRLQLTNQGTENLQLFIDQLSLEIIYLPLYTLMENQIGKTFLNISFIDSLASKYTYEWVLPEGGTLYNEFRFGSMINFVMTGDSFGIKKLCVHIKYPNDNIQTLCREFLYAKQPPTSLSTYVWHDLNADGLQGEDEPGMPGQTVELVQSDGTPVKTVISDESGNCYFELKKAGIFYLKWTEDPGFIPSQLVQAGDSTLDNNLYLQNDVFRTDIFTIKRYEQKAHIDIGLIHPARITGSIWHDMDGNNQQDPEDTGFSQINVNLYQDSVLVDHTATDEFGKYVFSNLPPGKYTCCFDRPDGALIAKNSAYTVSNEDADLTTCSEIFLPVQGVEHSTGTGLLFPGRITGKIWLDENENGTIEQEEKAFEGLKINMLETSTSNLVETVFTDEYGLFEFNKIYPGTYILEITEQPDFDITFANASGDPGVNSCFIQTDPNFFSPVAGILSGTLVNNLNAGFVFKKGSIGGRVWLDQNVNGKQDEGEPGMEGIEVQLFNGSGTLLQTMMTTGGTDEEKGYYSFQDVKPGNYYIRTDIPDLYVPASSQNELPGSESVITNQNGPFTSDIFTVEPAEHLSHLDAGLWWNYANIRGRIWGDNNENGIQDIGERGVAGVLITLFDQQEQLVMQTYSSASEINDELGSFSFTQIIPGKYYLQITPGQNGYVPTAYQAGNEPSLDSDFERQGDIIRTAWLDLAPGSANHHIDGGVILKENSIIGNVWHDENGDGLHDPTEQPVAGIRVKLFKEHGTELAEQLTDPEGKYFFNELTSGRYYVQFIPGDHWLFTISNPEPADQNSDVNHTFGEGTTRLIEIWHDTQISNVDAGLIYHYAAIETYIWLDEEANGLQDADESPVGNIPVKLYTAEGVLVSEQKSIDTGENAGKCIFEQIIPGEYYLVFDLPKKYKATLFQNGDPESDSDLLLENNLFRTSEFYLAGGSVKNDLDAGLLINYGKIGDYIWLDTNKNGYQDNDENGLNDLRVELFNESGELVKSVMSQYNTQTEKYGFYQFEQVDSGYYYLVLSIPDIYEMTANHPEHGELNSKLTGEYGIGSTSKFILEYGDSIYYQDFGLILKPSSIGDFIWLDHNKNGVQDADENGLNGIQLTLEDINGNIIKTTQSKFHPDNGSDGFYRFESLDPGKYFVRMNIPEDMLVSPAGLGDIDNDSDILDELGKSDTIELEAGQTLNSIDFGLYFKTAAIGGLVWLDQNENGLQDDQENGLDSILVHLYNESGENVMTVESRLDEVNQQHGYYRFEELSPGNYYIKVDVPFGYLPAVHHENDDTHNSDFTHQNGFGTTDVIEIKAGSATEHIDFGLIRVEAQLGDRVWLDINKNGLQDPEESGLNGLQIRLYNEAGEWINTCWSGNHPLTGEPGYWSFYNLPGAYYYVRFVIPVEYSNSKAYQGNNAGMDCDITHKFGPGTTDLLFLPDKFGKLDVDAGLFLETYSSIGNFVWEDMNANGIQEPDEPGINGINIHLYNENGIFLRKTMTGSTNEGKKGMYLFDYLPAGKYFLKVIVPGGYYLTTPLLGNDASADSDITHLNGPYTSSTITLGVKQERQDLDIGLYQLGSIGGIVWDDQDGSGIRNENEQGINQVHVELFDEGDNLIASVLSEENTETGSDGYFRFEYLDPGNYYLRFNFEENNAFTIFNAGDDQFDSDVTNENGSGTTTTFSLKSGETMDVLGAGRYTGGAKIKGSVWLDINGNGLKDDNESGLNGFKVMLNRENGTESADVKTYSKDQQEGFFEFFSVPAGNYYLELEKKENYVFSEQNNQTGQLVTVISTQHGAGTSDLFAVGSTDVITGMHCGVYRPAKISGLVWYDDNQNGIREENESFAPGISVRLFKNIYQEAAQLNTGNEGTFTFDGLLQDVYQIQVTPPFQFGFTQPGQGHEKHKDSDVTSDGKSALITVLHGANITHIDAGLVPVNNLVGGKVLVENQKSNYGEQQALQNVSFYLRDEAGNALAHTRSDASGEYYFYNIPTGKYRIKAEFGQIYHAKAVRRPGSVLNFDAEGYSDWFHVEEQTRMEDLDLVLARYENASEDQKMISVLPNPAQKTARFETNVEGKVIDRIIIYDLKGNMLIDEKVNFSLSGYIEMDISFLPGGLYRVYAYVGENAVSQKLLYKADE